MKRICLLACAIAGIVALASFGTQAQVMSQAPAPTEASRNCDQCKQMSEQLPKPKDCRRQSHVSGDGAAVQVFEIAPRLHLPLAFRQAAKSTSDCGLVAG